MSVMKEITLDEIKEIQLNILKHVDSFCHENNIRYYLAGGTLLGAIRHKGFIPWDDDIDIIMPRPDYIRFIKIYMEQIEGNYKLSSIYNNKHHLYTFAKIFDNRTLKIEDGIDYGNNNIDGIGIDIFPMDGLPEHIDISNKFFEQQRKYFRYYSLSVSKLPKCGELRNIIKLIATPLLKFIGKNRIIKFINERSMKYNFKTSKYVAVSVVPYYGNKERVVKSNFIQQIKVEFEGYFFDAPFGYDEYLTNHYGDYLKLPPEEKRVSHHKYKAYWKSHT